MKENMTNWIWIPHWDANDKEEPALVLFRKEMDLFQTPKSALIQISADSKYKLYVNGKMAEMGPSRGDRQIWFYDEVDLLPFLNTGKNVLAVQVLRYPMEHHRGNHGMFRTEFPGLYIKGSIWDTEEQEYILDADETWSCRKDKGFRIISEADGFAPLQIYEERNFDSELVGWMYPHYKERGWKKARMYSFMNKAASPGNLHPRTIPFLYRKDHNFKEVLVLRQSAMGRESWEKMLQGQETLKIPPYTREIVELSAGEEMTAYLHLVIRGGKGSEIRILQSESYVKEERHANNLPVKGRRDDWRNGHLEGFTDLYFPAGSGTAIIPEEYEPFWFRTFRFVRLEIMVGEVPLEIERFYYTETGYPLEVQTKIDTSDEELSAIWDISERSLRRCMHETYEDCPFYEQLQYAMDARSEILYTYAISADDRLARKCMDDFKRSQRYDGMLNCSYPCYGANIIPGFSIYYILMLYDHMMFFGDKELLEDHLPVIERILYFFHQRRTPEGYVASLGGLNGIDRKWSFIDWTPEWDSTTGVPHAVMEGALTMESLLYIMGLQRTADIAEYLGRSELARMYLERAEGVKNAVRKYCMGSRKMLTDGPGVEFYSQHVQVFAVLTHTVDDIQGKKNLEQTLLFPEQYAQCSVAMAWYLFRALQKTGLYEWTEKCWELWKRMLERGLTTCVEDEIGERSDCHAWGALILYELPSVILGIQPASPGYESVRICPHPGKLTYIKGKVVTPKGFIHVNWKQGENSIEYKVPDGVCVIADMSDLNR